MADVDRAGFPDVFDPDLIRVDDDHVVTRGGRGPRVDWPDPGVTNFVFSVRGPP